MFLKLVAGAMLIAAPAFAQTNPTPSTAPNATVPRVTSPGGPGEVNSGPGATGVISTEGTAAGNISNNPAGAGNAQQPNKASSTPSGGG